LRIRKHAAARVQQHRLHLMATASDSMETIATLAGNPVQNDAPAKQAEPAAAGPSSAAAADFLLTEELLRRLREAGL
jgi:hypothetical protein